MSLEFTFKNRARKGQQEPKPRRIIEPIEPITVDISTRPWDAGIVPLHDQLRERPEQPFIGEGLLMRASTEQLREVFSAIVKEQGARKENPWSEAEQQLVMDARAFMTDVHDGQFRQDGFTRYEHHLLRVASRAAQLDIANPYMVAVALLHDAPEDQRVTLEQMVDYFVHKKSYDFNLINMLFQGANALNNQRDSKKLPSHKYLKNIKEANDTFPDLHIWVIKGIDRYDSFVSDLSATVRNKEIDAKKKDQKPEDIKIRRADADKLKKTTEGKILPIRRRIRANEGNAGIVKKIDEAISLTEEMINDHGYKIKRGLIEGTIYTFTRQS